MAIELRKVEEDGAMVYLAGSIGLLPIEGKGVAVLLLGKQGDMSRVNFPLPAIKRPAED